MPVKKKSSKSAKNEEKKVENKPKKQKTNQKKKAGKELKRLSEQEEKISRMREDLRNQLISQNKFGEQFDDMIENYLFHVKLKDDLQYDIMTKGIRYEATTGNGYTTTKPNESITNLEKVSAEMRKILQDMELKEPDADLQGKQEDDELKEGEEDDLLS